MFFTPPSHQKEKTVNFYELTFARNIPLTAVKLQGRPRRVHTQKSITHQFAF